MSNQELANDIQAVHDQIAAHGWTQGDFSDSEGRCCLRGAAMRAFEIRGLTVEQLREQGTHYATALGKLYYDKARAVRFREFIADIIEQEIDLPVEQPAPGAWRMVHTGPSETWAGEYRELVAYYNDEVLPDQQAALDFLEKARIRAEEMA